MTEFFTVMLITFTVPGHGEMQSALLYPSEQACGEALPAVYGTIRAHYPDSMGQCRATPLMSASVRPRGRRDQ